MKTTGIEQSDEARGIRGTLLRVDAGRAVAIYLREGAAYVAEFDGSRCAVSSATAWFAVRGRRLAHAQRRGEVEIVSPLPAEIATLLEQAHARMALPADLRPLKRLAGFFGGLAWLLRSLSATPSRSALIE